MLNNNLLVISAVKVTSRKFEDVPHSDPIITVAMLYLFAEKGVPILPLQFVVRTSLFFIVFFPTEEEM